MSPPVSGASLRPPDRRRVDSDAREAVRGARAVRRSPRALPSRALSSTVLATMFSSSMLMLCGATAWVTAAAAAAAPLRAPGGPTPHLLPLPTRQLHAQINPPRHRPPPWSAAQSRREKSAPRLRFLQQRYPLTAPHPCSLSPLLSTPPSPSLSASPPCLKLLSETGKKRRPLTLFRTGEEGIVY